MKKTLWYLLMVIVLATGLQSISGRNAYTADLDESWKVEFNAVCGQTDNAADLSVAALKKAIEQCDALKPKIEALEATPRKVYLKRLQMCRNLFTYLLEGKVKN